MRETCLEREAQTWQVREMPVRIVWTDCDTIVLSASVRKHYFEIRAGVIYRDAPEEVCRWILDFYAGDGPASKRAKAEMRQWRIEALKRKKRRKTAEAIDDVPGTGVRLMKLWKTGTVYLEGRDKARKRDAYAYCNLRGTPLSRSREKLPQRILEVRGSRLSAPFCADDDASDWGQAFVLKVTEFSVNSRGMIASKVMFEEDANLAAYPWGKDQYGGLGVAVNELVEAWGLA